MTRHNRVSVLVVATNSETGPRYRDNEGGTCCDQGVSKAPQEVNPDLSVEDVAWNFNAELKVSSSAAKTLECPGFQASVGLGEGGGRSP